MPVAATIKYRICRLYLHTAQYAASATARSMSALGSIADYEKTNHREMIIAKHENKKKNRKHNEIIHSRYRCGLAFTFNATAREDKYKQRNQTTCSRTDQ